jgi:uncharacterized membrane protein
MSVLPLFVFVPTVGAQTLVSDTVVTVKAEVVEVMGEMSGTLPGTDVSHTTQIIRAKLLEGDEMGKVVTFDNDYLMLKVGEVFYARHTTNDIDGTDYWAVYEPYRLPVLWFVGFLFLACLIAFGGKQGVRGLLALVASLFFIGYLLLPGILSGYSPVLLSIAISSLIIVAGSYMTHGINRTTSAAVVGMLITIVLTGLLAYGAVHWGHFSGYTTDESTYLNFNTAGTIDFVGLLLGSLMIGLLGVLYDAAIGQAVAIDELARAAAHYSPKQLLARGLRIGREHIGALVNTLAIAYVGASLPLLLLFKLTSTQSIWITLNSELFATEIVRTLVGSIGLILAVPITTAVAVHMLHGRRGESSSGHGHRH